MVSAARLHAEQGPSRQLVAARHRQRGGAAARFAAHNAEPLRRRLRLHVRRAGHYLQLTWTQLEISCCTVNDHHEYRSLIAL